MLVLAVGALSIFNYYQHASLREQRRLVQELTARIELISKTANLDVQQKCARRAREAFSRDFLASLASDPFRDFTNHYNNKLSKCFVLITTHILNPKAKIMSDGRILRDAFEGNSYAVFSWDSESNKPSICEITLPSGEKRPCHSPMSLTN